MKNIGKWIKRIVLTLAVFTLYACADRNHQPEAATPTPVIISVPTAAPAPTPMATTEPEATPAPSPTVAYAGRALCIAKESVDIRAQAEKTAEARGSLPAGETTDVIAFEEEWAKIMYNNIAGYVRRDTLIRLKSPAVEVPSGDWTRILVNQTTLLPDSFTVSTADFEGGEVDARILEICAQMFTDAQEDGVAFKLVDAYRSYKTQSAQYEKKVQSYVAKGYSRAAAEAKAATITARPNTSEHQTGLALDIVTPAYTKRDSGFADTRAFKWLNTNAANYGFIMRYPAGKQDVTGVIYEPWHWRFVGVEAAKAMQASTECLEEYLGG